MANENQEAVRRTPSMQDIRDLAKVNTTVRQNVDAFLNGSGISYPQMLQNTILDLVEENNELQSRLSQ